jgi:glycosyltransferase involved in cell wall biosynthesis
MKIAVYAIAKDEAAHIDRFMAAVADADVVFVADTGSTDDTVARLLNRGAVVKEITVTPWRFDVARNRALSLLPEDVDVCFSLDLDDLVQPGWRAAIEAAWAPGVTRLSYDFVLTHTADGRPDFVYTTARIHARRGYHWEHAIHEEVAPDDAATERVVPCTVRVDHYPDDSKSRAGYLPLLEVAVAEEPESYRHAYWLGREYVLHGRHEEAIAELQRAVALPTATWMQHRRGMMDLLSKSNAALGRQQEAERWLLRACAEGPGEPETWGALAQARYDNQDWAGGLFAARRALATADLGPWRERAEDLASVCAWNIGAKDLARVHVAAALRLAPTDPRILGNARLMGVVDEPGGGIGVASAGGTTPFPDPVAAPPFRLVSTTLSGNSQEIIGDALRSVVDWVDWCLVIDTGISDDTLQIAREIAGEKLVVRHFPWQEDFAAARNFALQAAHELGAAWAITLDTDERIDVGAVDVRAALLATTAGSLHVKQASGTYGKERFFRLPARGRYSGPTHEAYLRDGGGSETLAGVVFAELDKSAEQYRRKAERDIAILSRHTEEHPNDPRWFYYLGDSYAGLERHEEAIAAFRACANLNGWDEESAWAMYRAAECLIKLGRPVEAIEASALGMARHAGLAELPWLAAYAAWQAGRPAQAVYWARQSIAMGHFAGAGERVPRIGFRHPPALWEGPYDVLRFALRQLGDDAGADEAEELFAQALADREDEED